MEITRSGFITGKYTFAEYYTAVLTTAGITRMSQCSLLDLARASSDPHFNDIPLHVWHGYAAAYQSTLSRALRAHGDFWSIAGGVCAIKQLVRNTIDKTT